jgi:hypothetical protein
MLRFLKDTWQEAKARVEAEDRAREEAKMETAKKEEAGDADAADNVADEMLRLARGFAAVATASGLALDFTPASLPAVDQLLARTREFLSTEAPDERRQQDINACIRMGAYVGEVLRRAEGGVWVRGSDGLPVVDLGSHLAPAAATVVGLFLHGRVDMPGGPVETLVAWYAVASTLSRESVEAPTRGGHRTLEDLAREMSDDPNLSAWLTTQVQLAVKTAQVKWATALDFTPASLDALEQVLAQLHDMLKTATPDERPSDKQIEGAASMWGAYVGEVFRRHCGGKWSVGSEHGLQLEIDGAKVFPTSKVWKRIMNGPGDAIPFYFMAVTSQLSRSRA